MQNRRLALTAGGQCGPSSPTHPVYGIGYRLKVRPRVPDSPSLDRLGLATANPLLRDVVAVGGGSAPPAGGPAAGGDSSEGQAGSSSGSSGSSSGGRLRITFQPDGGRIPYQGATMEVRMVTVKLTIEVDMHARVERRRIWGTYAPWPYWTAI